MADKIMKEVIVYIFLTTCVYGIGRLIYRRKARRSLKDRIVGWHILHWATACYFVGGMISVCLNVLFPPTHINAMTGGGLAFLGLLVGLAIGLKRGVTQDIALKAKKKTDLRRE